MRSINDVLRQKESQAEKLRNEIEKLREAARILEQGTAGVAAAPGSAAEPAKAWP